LRPAVWLRYGWGVDEEASYELRSLHFGGSRIMDSEDRLLSLSRGQIAPAYVGSLRGALACAADYPVSSFDTTVKCRTAPTARLRRPIATVA
jgi:hypothetical protein